MRVATYALRFIPFVLWRFSHPPEVTGQVDRTALIWFLQQFAAMQGSLCNQGIIVFLSKSSRAMQRTCNDAHSLELGSRVANGVFIYGESLREELVTELFKPYLVPHLTT